jgi:hypothetical protein
MSIKYTYIFHFKVLRYILKFGLFWFEANHLATLVQRAGRVTRVHFIFRELESAEAKVVSDELIKGLSVRKNKCHSVALKSVAACEGQAHCNIFHGSCVYLHLEHKI